MKSTLYTFDKLSQKKIGSFVFQLVKNRKLSDVYHCHDFYEIIFLINGTARQTVNDHSFDMNSGDGIILTPNDAHCFTEQSEDVFLVGLSVHSEEFLSFKKTMEIRSFSDKKTFHSQSADFVYDICKMIESERSPIQNAKLLLGHFLTLFSEGSNNDVLDSVKFRIDAALLEIKNEPFLKNAIFELAKRANYSYPHLYRLTRKYYGKTPHELILKMKMDTAYQKLVFTDDPISVIAAAIGFDSFAHFSNAFKKHFGKSPSSARRDYRRINSV